MASSIRSLYLSNCQDTTSSHFRPHGIPDSDSRSQQRISSVFLGKHFKWFWLIYNVSNLQSARKNLTSATAHPDMVDMDLHELSLGWMSGLYHTSACPDLCISRFGVIPKKKVINQIKWHLIMNGWAQGLWQRSWSQSYSPVSLGDLCYITVTLNSSMTMKDSLLLSAKAPQKTQLRCTSYVLYGSHHTLGHHHYSCTPTRCDEHSFSCGKLTCQSNLAMSP